MGDRLITPPAAEPVSVAELKAHLRVTHSADDAYLGELATAAREYTEQQMGRALAEQTREYTADTFPSSGVLRLGFAPVVSISSVKYLDELGAEQTLASSVYTVDTQSEPGALVLAVDQDWPETAGLPASVRVRYVCGVTPRPLLKQAILFIAAHWYEQRLPVSISNITNDIPHSLGVILWANRVINT